MSSRAQASQQQQEALKEEELIPVGDGVEDSEQETEESTEKEEEDEDESNESDERLASNGENDEESDDDDPDERERIRAYRRRRRKYQKQNRMRERQELEVLRRRNEELEQRLNGLGERVSNTEISTLDANLRTINEQIQLADRVMSAALNSQDPNRGEDFIKAQQARDQLIAARSQIQSQKENLSRRETASNQNQTSQQAAAPRPVGPVQRERATDWFQRSSWYNPNLSDPDSQTVNGIAETLERQGLNPDSHKYWDEFEKRVKSALPHRYEADEEDDDDMDEDNTQQNRRQPSAAPRRNAPVMKVGGRERTLKKGEVYISPERRKAMEEAGYWDDPVKRKNMLKRYAEQDRLNSSRR